MIVDILAVGIVAGVLLALHFVSKRPININIDARAEAHGGTAYTSAGEGSSGGGGVGGIFSGIARLFKLVLVGACVLVGAALLMQKSEPAKVVVNVPEQKPAPVVVNVPAQQAPIVNVPKAEPPVINVKPQSPVVNVPVSTSPLDIIGLIIGAVGSVIVIIVSVKMLMMIKGQDQPAAPQYQYPAEYERTSYGWTPKQQPGGAINANDVAPGLFNQKVDRKW